ncbi:MAG: sigma factor-like helix-turn-helix DNA-binding protein [Bacteroidota bacterium]
MGKQGEALLQTKPVSIYILYDNYAAMLLGYINEVVKDQVIAEEYLLKTFNTVAKKFNSINWNESNNWVHILRFAKAELVSFHEASKGYETPAIVSTSNSINNKYLDKMTDEQRHVFCRIYYDKKTTAELSKEINKPGELIKTLLKEAFNIIRESNEG